MQLFGTARRSRKPKSLEFDACEGRVLTALVFVLNGASFAAAGPSHLTANASAVLRHAGERVVQVSYSAIRSVAAFQGLEARITRLAQGQSIGLVGFSAGGALALRLSTAPGLHVSAVLDYYGVPDVQSYLNRHTIDRNFRPISGLAPFRPALVSILSGPLASPAHIVGCFGLFDANVRADSSVTDLRVDAPTATTYVYEGGHGAPITASRPALEDFLAHLQ